MKSFFQLYEVLTGVVLFLSLCYQGRAQTSIENLLRAQQSWHINCMPRGCIASVDILRGESGDPPNPNDSSQYISVAVGVGRSGSKPSFVMFEVDPHADQQAGVELLFAHSVPNGDGWKVVTDPNGPTHLPFRRCDQTECSAVLGGGKADEKELKSCADLVAKMQSESHLFLSYDRGGRHYRTAVSLTLFQEAYAQLLTQASATQKSPSAPQ